MTQKAKQEFYDIVLEGGFFGWNHKENQDNLPESGF